MVAQGLECFFHPDPTKGFNINLVGKLVLHVTGDRVIVQIEVGTSSGNLSAGYSGLGFRGMEIPHYPLLVRK